eukprot:CAMPEP_0195538414 /NCGR_PEP_ID=MMETSP0794_2-20130614/49512_1 /TAXON_ID=515487 /ORGANISM="Stephanopyxis turris, Strain CCMP 815" /LENGTH=157 /DNA_ID=CAMNT_0040672389 /DNA_START=339 /DNA_END=812 /DNA_ORIENTATION=-
MNLQQQRSPKDPTPIKQKFLMRTTNKRQPVDDKEKREKRLASNRRSAQKSRYREMVMIEELQQRVEKLRKQNQCLQEENILLQQEFEALRQEELNQWLAIQQQHQHQLTYSPQALQVQKLVNEKLPTPITSLPCPLELLFAGGNFSHGDENMRINHS